MLYLAITQFNETLNNFTTVS